MITAEIQEQVRRRAGQAASEREIGNIVIDALLSHDVDVRRANRDGVKQLIVEGVRAFRLAQRHGEMWIAG